MAEAIAARVDREVEQRLAEVGTKEESIEEIILLLIGFSKKKSGRWVEDGS